MSVFTLISLPMMGVALVLLFLAWKRKEKNFLFPFIALMTAGFVNLIIGFTLG